MPIAITPDHETMSAAATAWAKKNDVLGLTRRLIEDTQSEPGVDRLWAQGVAMGWPALLVPEEQGGSGQTVAEAVLLMEALGGSCAPLPLIGTLAVSSVLDPVADESAPLLRGIAAGEVRIGVGARPALLSGDVVTGDLGPVEGGGSATHIAVFCGADVLIAARSVAGVSKRVRAALDPSRGTSQFTVHQVALSDVVVLAGAADKLRATVRLLAAADAVGVARACLTIALEYAAAREAFGRTIGSFQAVKHHCADMLLDTEVSTAATWRAANSADSEHFSALAGIAYCLASRAGLRCAKTALQIHGGIGFTWEHDIHLFLRRAAVDASILGPAESIVDSAGRAEIIRQRPQSQISLPPEAEAFRSEAVAFREQVLAAPAARRHELIVDGGYLYPHWPPPYGLGAGPVQQLVIEEETRDLDRISALGATHWELPIILPTVLAFGTAEQQQRWMRPTMTGQTHWCQLFSEPGAGSDLAALSTRAVRCAGGWKITGQKVWTSDAHHADIGLALVRTNPDAAKHKGITCMVVDLRSEGVSIRPLRQITGSAEFNEVFLDDVFVPDDNVVGDVDNGWVVARATLGFERVSLGVATWNNGPEWEELMRRVESLAGDRPELVRQAGEIAIVAEGATALAQRSAFRAVMGQPTGIEGSIAKLLVAEHAHQVGDFALELLAEDAAFADDGARYATTLFLQCRMATIAGGTSEVLRNLLAERALGMPRERES